MPLPPPPPRAASLRVWVRRSVLSLEAVSTGWSEAPRVDGPSVYAVRYASEEGRALLRIARPGVLIDPPPRPTGEEDGLTVTQLRESRLLHAEDAGRARRAWSFGRLDPVALAALPGGEWIELRSELVHGQGWMLLAERRREVAGGEEPTSPKRMLDTFREEMEAGDQRAAQGETVGAPPGAPSIGPSVVPLPDARHPGAAASGAARNRRWSQDEPTEIPSSFFDDEAPTQRGPRPESVHPIGPPPSVEPAPSVDALVPVAADAPPHPEGAPPPVASPMGAVAEPSPAAPSAREEAVPGAQLHQRNTTLVRHLRRRLLADEQRIRELEALLKKTGGGR